MSTQARLRNGIINAINEAQRQHHLMERQLNKQKGFLHIKSLYIRYKDHREVNKRLRRWIKEQKQQQWQEEERKRRIQDAEANDTINIFRIDITKLSNAKTAQLAKDISEQSRKIAQQIREEQGGLFKGYRNFSKQNRKSRIQEKRAERKRRRDERRFFRNEKRKERELEKLRVNSERKRIVVEVRDERLAAYELKKKRKLAKKLGYW